MPANVEKGSSHLQFSSEYQDQGFFLEDTNPLNPYGPNYYYLAYDTKVYNKFIRLRRYVHFDASDNDRLIRANIYYFLGIVGSFLVGLSFGIAAKRVSGKRFTKLNDLMEDYPRVYFGIMGSLFTTIGYSFLNDYYMNRIYFPFMEKYLGEAKMNGFEDYTIDESYKEQRLSAYVKKYLAFGF